MHACRSTLEDPTISQEAGAESDTVRFSFPEKGCSVGKAEFKGSGSIVLTGDEKAGRVSADLSALEVGEFKLATTVGYETCAKDPAVQINTAQKGDKLSYDADLRVARKKGAPIFGSTSFVLDGTTKIDRAGTVETATFTTLEYKPGEFLPKSGTVALSKEGGHAVTAEFKKKVSRLGTATITVDGGKPVTVPIVR